MVSTIDMKLMRYINLFAKISGVTTTKVFLYNNQIIFAVPKNRVSVAIGKRATNVKKLNEILRRNIKIIIMPKEDDIGGINKFVENVVSPIEFNKIETRDNSTIITAGRQSKAALIGRGRQREKELSDVLKSFFGIVKFRIV